MRGACTFLKLHGRPGNGERMQLSVSVQVRKQFFSIDLKNRCELRKKVKISVCKIAVRLAVQNLIDLFSVGYQSLVGNNEHSWGWDLGRNKVYHNSKVNPGVTYPPNLKTDETFVVPDKFLGECPF